jgi:NADH-quinone oxidoreductase subunit J
MALQAIAFYLMALVTLGAAFGVVSREPGALGAVADPQLFSAAGLFVLLGAEFLAMLLVVVYVGAVAVLFLFVVMMLDVDFAACAGVRPLHADRPGGGRDLAAEMVLVSTSVAAAARRGPAPGRWPRAATT